MFTIEMDWDETAITVLDPDGKYEDIQAIIYDDIVYIRQFDPDIERWTLMTMSPKQYFQLMRSFSLPEGAYMLQQGDNE